MNKRDLLVSLRSSRDELSHLIDTLDPPLPVVSSPGVPGVIAVLALGTCGLIGLLTPWLESTGARMAAWLISSWAGIAFGFALNDQRGPQAIPDPGGE